MFLRIFLLFLSGMFVCSLSAEGNCSTLGPNLIDSKRSQGFNKWVGKYTNDFMKECKWKATIRFKYHHSDNNVDMAISYPEHWEGFTLCPGKHIVVTGSCVNGNLELNDPSDGRLVGIVHQLSSQLRLNSSIAHYELSGTS
jgi:hypothetical protein